MTQLTDETMKIEDPIIKPIVSNIVDRKKGNEDSDLQVKLHHANMGNALEKSTARKDANTNISAYSTNHPGSRENRL